ncbi:hypothetical protein DUNSADRAFT_10204 [Dunaliella salina]|uniref:Esterase n=1 Tax=Dunaliella salina TaxID=3046 RepID=A0ABQ7GFW9_DUNSA|nr:hypothetical protein DUNSADRAFT_10204 [Dunaliella salina]|eukprot:KAF5833483.1 hypothetical protein DUNSADRAFT_10204 [Dunaliella salina]
MGRHSTFLKRAQQLSCKHPFSQPPFSQHGMARFQVSFINAAIQQWKDLRARLAAALDPTLGDACLKSRNGLLFIPSTYDHKQPSPMILMLHGSDASGMNCAHLFRWEELEEHRVIMLLPDARDACGRTWDVNVGGFGADVRFIDSGHIAYRLESMGFPPPDAHQGSFIFHEFLGGHCVPTEVASRALRWFLD